MRWIVALTACTFVHFAFFRIADADQPRDDSREQDVTLSASNMTPEMWFYVQEWRRHDDPARAIRRKAEFRASQRRYRIAARKWYGYSNSRPRTSSVPWFGTYWPISSGYRPERFRWFGSRPAAIIINRDVDDTTLR